MIREVHPAAAGTPSGRGARVAAAAMLRAASAVLDRLAASLAQVAESARHVQAPEPVLEFYAEAGAPEGALYIDGEFVGALAGVTRL